MTSTIEKEYLIPSLGAVRIIHVNGESGHKYHGEYYANVENYGNAGRFAKSVKDAEAGMLVEIKTYLTQEKEKLQEEMEKINKGLELITQKLSESQIPQLNVGGKK